jgi:hypothetical protein
VALSSLSATLVAIVAAVSLVLALITFAAAKQTAQRRIYVIALAFTVHFVKSTLAAWALFTAGLGHETLEILEAGFDLVMVLLLFSAFWVRR